MTIPSQHYANLSGDSYRLDHRVGYHPPGDRDKVRMAGAVYEVVEFVDNKNTGYQGVIYQRVGTGEIVVAHRGTEFGRELINDGLRADGGMVVNELNSQAQDAIALTRRALQYAQKHADMKNVAVPEVTVTGHSLGGALAQITAHHFDLKAETFNAYGAAGLKGINPREANAANVTNHVMAGDFVSAASPHYGKVVMYATAREIDRLGDAGYGNRYWNDPSVAIALAGSHKMRNFLDDPATPGRNESVLSSNAAKQLAISNSAAIGEYRTDILELRTGVTTLTQQGRNAWNDALDRSNRGLEWVGHTAEQGVNFVQRGAKRAQDAAQSGWNWLDQKAGEGAELLDRTQQKFNEAGKDLRERIMGRPVSDGSLERAMDGVRSYLPAKDGDLKDAIGGSAAMINAQASATPNAGGPRAAAPTLESDPSAFLDRMLAAAKSGDADTFRQMTQQAANGEAGRALREQAIAAVDQQEQLAREQAELSAMQQASARQMRQSAPVMG